MPKDVIYHDGEESFLLEKLLIELLLVWLDLLLSQRFELGLRFLEVIQELQLGGIAE